MHYRSLRILFIAFQAIWLNVIVPGHSRGAVTLGPCADGSCASRPVAHGCCGSASAKGKSPAGTPTPGQQARCAVCAFAARVTPPPVIDLRPPALELLCVSPVVTPEVAESLPPRLAYHGRAPPTVA